MKNKDVWKPTKYVCRRGSWIASRDPREVAISSRLVADLAVNAYAVAIRKYARGHLVDLGCGKAPLFGIYRDFVEEVTCVDWANSLHIAAGSAHIDVYCDLNDAFPLPSSNYDTALSTDVLEHIWNHRTYFSEIARILKPGGHLILGTPFLYWVHEAPIDYFRWTPFALRKACEEYNLYVISIQPFGGGLDVLADVLQKTSPKVLKRPLAAITGALLHAWPLRRISDRSSSKMPLGHVLIAKKQ